MEERFLSKVDKNGAGGCWNWTAFVGPSGYGTFWADGETKRAHRIAYELWIGEIPDGLIVRHKCRLNRKCVNPEHLEIGTHQDNMNDMKKDATRSIGICRPHSKLNDDSVKEITTNPDWA
jgi:hypothetical protein